MSGADMSIDPGGDTDSINQPPSPPVDTAGEAVDPHDIFQDTADVSEQWKRFILAVETVLRSKGVQPHQLSNWEIQIEDQTAVIEAFPQAQLGDKMTSGASVGSVDPFVASHKVAGDRAVDLHATSSLLQGLSVGTTDNDSGSSENDGSLTEQTQDHAEESELSPMKIPVAGQIISFALAAITGYFTVFATGSPYTPLASNLFPILIFLTFVFVIVEHIQLSVKIQAN
jgi:hypothetical protein